MYRVEITSKKGEISTIYVEDSEGRLRAGATSYYLKVQSAFSPRPSEVKLQHSIKDFYFLYQENKGETARFEEKKCALFSCFPLKQGKDNRFSIENVYKIPGVNKVSWLAAKVLLVEENPQESKEE